jgi:hypothetical protein
MTSPDWIPTDVPLAQGQPFEVSPENAALMARWERTHQESIRILELMEQVIQRLCEHQRGLLIVLGKGNTKPDRRQAFGQGYSVDPEPRGVR